MQVDELVARASDTLHVSRCFGTPIERDGSTVIPVAFVVGGGGGGSGGPPDGEGQGGGWGGASWPLGVYEIRDGRVRWIPAVDATRVALGALALVRTVVRARRRRH